jgi:integrase
MTAPAHRPLPEPTPADRWAGLRAERPELSSTARRYLAQIEVSMSPATMEKTDEVLACFCAYLVASHPEVHSFADMGRRHIEAYKAHLARRATPWGTPLKPNTRRAHLTMLRVFFDRIIEWGYPEAPAFTPVFRADLPKAPEPLPKALDDAASARFLAATAQGPDRCRQLCLEILARTGMRVGELCALRADALSSRSGSWWTKVPVGKLRNDRYVPAHPRLVELVQAWQAVHDDNMTGLLITVGGKPLDRFMVARWVRKVARAAGIGAWVRNGARSIWSSGSPTAACSSAATSTRYRTRRSSKALSGKSS